MKTSLLKLIKESNLYRTITKNSENITKNTLVNTCDSMTAEIETIAVNTILNDNLDLCTKQKTLANASGIKDSDTSSPTALRIYASNRK